MKNWFAPLLLLVSLSLASAQTPQLAPLPPNGFVTLEQIVGDFRLNSDLALQKYGGNQIIVYGRVGDVELANDGQNVANIFLQEFQKPTPDVKAQFAADAFRQGAQIQISSDETQIIEMLTNSTGQPGQSFPFAVVDQRVGIKGSFSGYQVGDIILKDCKKLSAEEVAPLLPK